VRIVNLLGRGYAGDGRRFIIAAMHTDVLPWLEYRWSFDFPTGMFRALLERLRGTPARLEELVGGASPQVLIRHEPGKWTAQGNAGHLWMVDALWQVRIREMLAAGR
jgi:hypothetical protein